MPGSSETPNQRPKKTVQYCVHLTFGKGGLWQTPPPLFFPVRVTPPAWGWGGLGDTPSSSLANPPGFLLSSVEGRTYPYILERGGGYPPFQSRTEMKNRLRESGAVTVSAGTRLQKRSTPERPQNQGNAGPPAVPRPPPSPIPGTGRARDRRGCSNRA